MNRGEIHLADLGDPIGHEQASQRPVLVVSAQNWLDTNPPVIAVLPITRIYRNRSTHLEIESGASGLAATSYAKCEDIRAISPDRLLHGFGRADDVVMSRARLILQRLLDL